MEILYLWINKNESENVYKQGLNFSPEIKCRLSANGERYILSLEKTGKMNIMRGNKKNNNSAVLNTTMIVGKNGTGKTSILKYLLSLPIVGDDTKRENEHEINRREKNRFLVVAKDTKYKIITNINSMYIDIDNRTGLEIKKVFYDDNKDAYNDLKHNKELNELSVIYLSNSAFCSLDSSAMSSPVFDEKTKEYSGRYFDKLVFTSEHLKEIADNFYSYGADLNKTLFASYSLDVLSKKASKTKDFQQICDLYYYGGLLESMTIYNNLTFRDKFELNIDIPVKEFANPDYKMNVPNSYFYYYNETIKRDNKNYIIQKLKSLLTLEYIFIDSVCKSNDIYNKQQTLVEANEEGKFNRTYNDVIHYVVEENVTSGYKEYIKNAIDEINKLEKIVSHCRMRENDLPVNDAGFKTGITIDIFDEKGNVTDTCKEFLIFIRECVENNLKHKYGSFSLRYLVLDNYYQSSGERAFLNIFSWLYWLSKLGDITSQKRERPKKHMLLLLDEVDEMCHPEWQRDIIGRIIDTINEQFSEKKVQIIATTHSPLCLGNVPSENIIYLKKEKNMTVVDETEHKQTFGLNLYDLLDDAFYLDGNTMGSYAVEYMNNVLFEINEIVNNEKRITTEEYGEFIKKLDYIGDPFIKGKMIEKLEGALENTMKIELLKKKRNELDLQITELENNNYAN